ncbi:glycosyltransferase family 4 protein [Catenulispora rubra]|uniref:glycosyltransferase family 4 protein n=1 Tax=Catenulispora rubra TaxID=280293 RepID=UPI0018926718|nr:glycosyltransferase family 4 protein [Catenulispora rubra]
MTTPDQRRVVVRPRVVMLVGNFIDGDSRVQKEARSAAEAGWETYLVGRSRSGKREESKLGEVTVLRPAESMAATKYRTYHPRRSGVSGLIAYSTVELGKVKHQRQRIRQSNLAVERELLSRRSADGLNPAAKLVDEAVLAAKSLGVKAAGYWISARKQSLDHNYNVVQDSPSTSLEKLRVRRGGEGAVWNAQPRLVDFEDSFGRAADELEPDLIHANDAEMLGVAVRAAARAKAKGRTVKVIYDAHEFFAGDTRDNPTWAPAMAAQEAKYLPLADAVMSPIEGYAEAMIEFHGLAKFPGRQAPVLVKNMPALADLAASGDDVPGVRGALGLAGDVPLLVHPGSVTKVRGLQTVVEALPELDGVHAALLVGRRDGYVAELVAMAQQLGVSDRFHLLDYVPSEELTAYLRSATIGIDTLLHIPLHELTITTKFWSYISAGLPVVASDVKATSQLTRELGNGEVYTAGDVKSFVEAARKVLKDPAAYTKAYSEETLRQYSWEGQAETMLDLYREVTGRG